MFLITLILVFSIVGCDNKDGTNGIDGITGPSHHGIEDDQHVNFDSTVGLEVCDAGFDWDHDNSGTTCRDANGFDVLGYNVSGLDADGCTSAESWSLDSVGDGSNIAGCV